MRMSPIRSGGATVAMFALLALLPAGCGVGGATITRNIASTATTARTSEPTAQSTSQSTSQSTPQSTAAAGSVPPGTPAVIPVALRFTGTTLDGKPFDAASLAGRPVILWFWAPWCAVCFGQAASVTDVAQQYAGRVSLLGIAGLDQSTKAMKDFVTEGEVGNVPHLNDRTGVVWKKFGITQQSYFVMINRSGVVMQTGFQDTITLSQWAAYLDEH